MSSYVVRHASARTLLAPLAFVGALVVWVLVLDVSRTLLVLVIVTFLGATALSLRRAVTRLRIDAKGVTFSPVHAQSPPVLVPWGSVREVVVVAGATVSPRVGVRLQPDAPLPRGVRGMIWDPARPDAVQPLLSREVPGLDRRALTAAVQAHGGRVVDVTAL